MPVSATALLSPPPYMQDTEQWKVLMSSWGRNANQGHISNIGRMKLASGTVQTVLVDVRISAFTFIGLSPTSANAASESPYIASQSKGAATIVHANAATGDRTYTYCILG